VRIRGRDNGAAAASSKKLSISPLCGPKREFVLFSIRITG
jgi:hypothetical protein